ncbi:hypothetical protein [Tetragenococcus halophilus]|nr:hypothetical protein [Tetragenococcus halophilus]
MQYIYTDYYRKYGKEHPKPIHRIFPWLIDPQIRHFILIRK